MPGHQLSRAMGATLQDVDGGRAGRRGPSAERWRATGVGTGRSAGNLVWKLRVSTRSPLPLSTGGRERGGGPDPLSGELSAREGERRWGGCPGG